VKASKEQIEKAILFIRESLEARENLNIVDKIVVNIDFPTKFELTGKKYVIFKDFYMVDNKTLLKSKTKSTNWLFGEWFENKDSDVEIINQLKSFKTLQECFKYAKSLDLLFL